MRSLRFGLMSCCVVFGWAMLGCGAEEEINPWGQSSKGEDKTNATNAALVTNLSAYGLSSFSLQPFERTEVVLRYLDVDGYPIVNGNVRLKFEPEVGHGATISALVPLTDQQGLARTTMYVQQESTFQIIAEADGADPVRMNVQVSKSNGGMVEVQVYNRSTSAADGTQATVTLVNNISCATFEPMTPPAQAAETNNAMQPTALSTSGTTVSFSGLSANYQYAIVAIARDSNQKVVAKACTEGISVTQDEINSKVSRRVSLYLEDYLQAH